MITNRINPALACIIEYLHMEKNFQSVEEVVMDEQFQAWYFKTDDVQAAAFEQWLRQHPAQQELVDKAVACMQLIVLKEQAVPAAQTAASARRLLDSLGASQTPVITMRPARRRWWWSAAAAVLLVAAGAFLWTSLARQSSVQTAYGQVAQQQLPDGSQVFLNANSSISYSSGWDKGREREVWIKGEAFFHVKKTAAKTRFVVHTDQLDVIVTGTQFNVTSKPDKSSVMLTEGSVFIRTRDGKEVKMSPGDFIEFANSQLEKKAVKEETVLAWKEKKILFDNTPISEVVQKIKEHYGQDVEIADKAIERIPISGMMPNDNLDVLLQSLEATQEVKVIRKDSRIIITQPQ